MPGFKDHDLKVRFLLKKVDIVALRNSPIPLTSGLYCTNYLARKHERSRKDRAMFLGSGLSTRNGNVPLGYEPLVDGNMITGRVVDVQQQSVFKTTAGKAMALIFDGQPWQFGSQVLTTTIFVEGINAYSDSSGFNQQRGLVFHGNINAAVRPGHIIQAKVRQKGGQLYVSRLSNLTTNSCVTPTSQIGGWPIVLAVLAVASVPVLLLLALAAAFADGSLVGGFTSLLSGLLEALGPSIVVCVGIYLLVKSLFK